MSRTGRRRTAKGPLAIAPTFAALTAFAAGLSYALEPPAVPVAAFYTSSRTDTSYVRAVARSLKEHGLNAVVANESFTRGTVDVFQSQGIAVIARGDALLDHPAVIAAVVGDGARPGTVDDTAKLKRQYQEVSGKTGKPVIVCVPSEAMGLFGPDDPRRAWDQLKPAVRCFRWYGISRSHYGVLHKCSAEGRLSLSSVLSIAQTGETPYWVVVPAFGTDDHEAQHQNPTPAQIKAMTHLALAYRARGILYWALQDHDGWNCLADERTLSPTDGKYAAVAEMAALVKKHADLLGSLKHTGMDIRCPDPVVAAVPQQGGDGALYVYAVNKDTRQSATTRLMLWDDNWNWSSARDVFGGEDLRVAPRDEEGYLGLPLSLAPGEGKLILTNAQHEKKKQK